MGEIIYPVICNQAKLPFYLSGIGTTSPEYHIKREQGLVSHQFLFTSSGSGTLTVNGISYHQSAGSIFYIAPKVPHEYYPNNNCWTSHWIVFRGVNLAETMTSLGFPDFVEADNVNLEMLQGIFKRIINAANNSVDGAEKCSELLYEYILVARKILISKYDMQTMGTIGIAENAVKYIDEHYADDITLPTLADFCGISLQHFDRVFKAKTGMRPMEYVARRRVSQAKLLLSSSDNSISNISRIVGYSDNNYFGIVFRKYEGVSPTEFRKLNGCKII